MYVYLYSTKHGRILCAGNVRSLARFLGDPLKNRFGSLKIPRAKNINDTPRRTRPGINEERSRLPAVDGARGSLNAYYVHALQGVPKNAEKNFRPTKKNKTLNHISVYATTLPAPPTPIHILLIAGDIFLFLCLRYLSRSERAERTLPPRTRSRPSCSNEPILSGHTVDVRTRVRPERVRRFLGQI